MTPFKTVEIGGKGALDHHRGCYALEDTYGIFGDFSRLPPLTRVDVRPDSLSLKDGGSVGTELCII